MSFRRECPVTTPIELQERLVCPDCGIGFGVTMALGNRKATCWLIRLSNFSSLEGVRKIA